jgi:putative protease
MKKIELLAPAGNMESLYAAIEAGADAIYLGGKNFGARAFSKNFNDEEMVKAINYAHIYGVKVYVTCNTLIYDREVSEFLKYVEFLHKNNVDAILIQDLGMLDLIRKTYPKLEVHSSTQMHIHNLDGTKLMEDLGVKRVVLARETSFKEIKHIKENTNVELEVFVHGALCVSYSGQCLMSYFNSSRSANQGACEGSCRLKYNVLKDNQIIDKDVYALSLKDLNSLENIGRLIDLGVSSLKIEGRMKSPAYVYLVTSLYREAIDSYYKEGKVSINKQKLHDLKVIFNREYTRGFLFNVDNTKIVNMKASNH